MSIDHTRDWITFIISIVTTVLAVGICFGALNNKVTTLEEAVKTYSIDHDVLIRISEKIDIVQRDVKEIKLDMKKHLEK